MSGIPFDAVNAAALAAYPRLLHEWLPAGREKGREFLVGDLLGNAGQSLSINTVTGKWADFASGEKGGDPISLAAALFHRGDRVEAARELGTKLGVYLNGNAKPVPVETKLEPDWRPIVPPPADAVAPDTSGFDAVHTYRDSVGRPLFFVRRREARGEGRKQFVPLTYGILDGKRGWHAKHPASPRPLYGLDRLANSPAARVIVCEGEKAADAAQRLVPSMVSVTWPAGSNSVASADWSALAGRDVTIWPDNDKAGHQASLDIASILAPLAASVSLLRVDDLADKADAADVTPPDPLAWLTSRTTIVSNPEPEPPFADDDPGYWESLTESADANTPAPHLPRRARVLTPIRVVAGEIDVLADLGERALVDSRLPVYQRGNALVRPIKHDVPSARGGTTTTAGLGEIGRSGLIDLLNQSVEWQKFDGRRKKWTPCDPPDGVASVILSRAGQWTIPPIAGVITTPTIRPDGSLLSRPGYDPVTRLFHVADRGLELLPEVTRPTRRDAVRALAELNGLLSAFPFVSDIDRAVALSAIVTCVTRGALSVAPMHAFRAFAAGTGKSYLADVMSYIATGRACPVMAAATQADETEKRLVGLLLSAVPIISIDNVNGDLGGDLLCQAVERPLVRVRALGASDIMEIESRATIIATGNGFRVRGDMSRRTLICTLDAKVERPEQRVFEFDPVENVIRDRGRYVSACLTIVRAYLLAGEPVDLVPLASFGDWSSRVRAALVWLGCADPVASIETAREDDPELADLRQMVGLWREHIGLIESITARELVERSLAQHPTYSGEPEQFVLPGVRDVLLGIAGERGVINPRRLGNWFSRYQGRIADGVRFEKRGADCGSARWRLTKP